MVGGEEGVTEDVEEGSIEGDGLDRRRELRWLI